MTRATTPFERYRDGHGAVRELRARPDSQQPGAVPGLWDAAGTATAHVAAPDQCRRPATNEGDKTMTAPDPRALLDALDEAHTKATPAPWSIDEDGDVIAATDPYSYLSTGMALADAAAIVAAHNALPALVDIVRELWDEHDGRTCVDRTGPSLHGDVRCATRSAIAGRLATVTAALPGGQA